MLAFPSVAYAQDQASFNTSWDKYKQAEQNYVLKRGAYLSSKTIAAEGEAQEATYEMLKTRDEAIASYLKLLKSRLNEATGIDTPERQTYESLLDTELEWFENHAANLSSGATLADMVADSNTAKTRYDKNTMPVIYKLLSQIAIGKENFLRLKQQSIINDLNNKVSQIRGENIVDVGLIEGSLLQIGSTLSRSEAKSSDAKTALATIDKKPADASKVYATVVTRIKEGVNYLKDANTYLKEIMYRITRS
jgi:hypothetical protein